MSSPKCVLCGPICAPTWSAGPTAEAITASRAGCRPRSRDTVVLRARSSIAAAGVSSSANSLSLIWVDSFADRTKQTAELVDQLHAVVEKLEELHPGRKFPLDGHLVGSLGEAAGEALFDLTLRPPSNPGYDATSVDGRTVEIKATYGNGAVAIRSTSHDHAESLIVLRLSRRSDQPTEEIYNGPFAKAAGAAGRTGSNGQAPIRLSKLRALNAEVDENDRIPRRTNSMPIAQHERKPPPVTP